MYAKRKKNDFRSLNYKSRYGITNFHEEMKMAHSTEHSRAQLGRASPSKNKKAKRKLNKKQNKNNQKQKKNKQNQNKLSKQNAKSKVTNK